MKVKNIKSVKYEDQQSQGEDKAHSHLEYMAELEIKAKAVKGKARARLLGAIEKALPIQHNKRFSVELTAEFSKAENDLKGKEAKIKEGLKLSIHASDATALRAALNSYLRILQVIEKLEAQK